MFGVDDAALAIVAAGAMSSAGALYTNSQNRKFQGEVNQESINLANTAHQREIADLKAAGLNPILSASGAGASLPSLGVASQINPGEGIADGITGASKYVSQEYKETVENIKAQNTHADLINSSQRLDNAVKAEEYQLEKLRVENDEKLEMVRNKALESLTGVNSPNGHSNSFIFNKKFNKAVRLERSAIVAGIKMRANENMRANIKTATDIANGASDIALKGKKIKAKPISPNRSIRLTLERKK